MPIKYISQSDKFSNVKKSLIMYSDNANIL